MHPKLPGTDRAKAARPLGRPSDKLETPRRKLPRETSGTTSTSPHLTALVRRRRSGWTLPQPFFRDPEIYQVDLEKIWRTGWLFAGHSCEVRKAGAYFLVPVDTDSVIIVRDRKGVLHAHHNVCRHRGSVLCDATQGILSRIVCPYHQWSYDLDGRLAAWRSMPADLDRGDFGLKPVAIREVEGLIFISLAKTPTPFEAAYRCLAPLLRPQGFQKAKVAAAADYRVNANWKIVWENNRECYHCNANHPQYIQANFDHYNADDTTPLIRQRMQEASARMEARWIESGLATHRETGMTPFPDAKRGIWFSGNRTPLVDGWVSETMDGHPVAPLMGAYTDPNVGTLRIRTLPNFWNHSSCDHGVSTRLLPAGPQHTVIRVWWLVDENAQEGRDYDLGKLMPFWQLTSEQDWEICERQQRGINSSAYEPGPYSPSKEYNVESFVQWYLKSLQP
ncbi:MAG: aromatic ring-hydroxylating dioxygenase subunit alpha [Pedosphaera sp.]|nr:aromatic ring-hydroxylating dioxygenase subunit alpha [Pedosphaera sp.]